MANVRVKIFRVNPLATLPKYAHEGDSGMDLTTPVDITLEPGVPTFVDIGIAIAVPVGYEGQIRSRSGLTKRGITACSGLGTVDAGYRGSVGVTLMWHLNRNLAVGCWNDGVFKVGDKIAQLVIVPVAVATLEEVESFDELGASSRGTGGFGSTGR